MPARYANCGRRLVPTAGLLLVAALWHPSTGADEGLYVSAAVERSLVGVDYAKTVEIDAPYSNATATDDVREAVHALRAAVGYRQPLSDRLYLAGEIDGFVYLDDEVTGFLAGSGEGDTDVWPGAWSVERRHAGGLGARLGYVPERGSFAGAVRSLYLFSGIRWADFEVEAAHVNQRLGISGSREWDDGSVGWVIGGGIEFGVAGGHFDLRLAYVAHDIEFGAGNGLVNDPTLGYSFEVRELSVMLGYVVPLGG